MKHLVAVVLLLALARPSSAQSVTLPAEVKVPVGRLAAVTIDWDGDDVRWDAPAALDCFREYSPDAKKVRLRLIGYAPGTHRLVCVAAKGGKLSDFGVCIIVVGEPVPPDPKPPDPKPPDPKPGPVSGLRVLIVEESADRAKLPVKQYNVLFDKTVQVWLNANCRPWEKIRDWGIFDQNTDLSGYSKDLQALMARPRTSTPWIVIASDGGVLHEGPLPADVPATLSLLGKFGPAKRKAG